MSIKKYLENGFQEAVTDKLITEGDRDYLVNRILPSTRFIIDDIKKSIKHYHEFGNDLEQLKNRNEEVWDKWTLCLQEISKNEVEIKKWLKKEDEIEKIVEIAIKKARIEILKYDFRVNLITWFSNILIKTKHWFEDKKISERAYVSAKTAKNHEYDDDNWQPGENLKELVECCKDDLMEDGQINENQKHQDINTILPYLKWIEKERYVKDRKGYVKDVVNHYLKDGEEVKSLESNNQESWKQLQIKLLDNDKNVEVDIVNKLCEKLKDKLKTYRFEGPFENWLSVIIKNIKRQEKIKRVEPFSNTISDTNEDDKKFCQFPDIKFASPKYEAIINRLENREEECWGKAKELVRNELRKVRLNNLPQEKVFPMLEYIFLSQSPDIDFIICKYGINRQSIYNRINRVREMLRGLKVDDIIIEFEKGNINNKRDIVNVISRIQQNIMATVKVNRPEGNERKNKTIITVLKEKSQMNEGNINDLITERLGIDAVDITNEMSRELALRNVNGILVRSVNESFTFRDKLRAHFKEYEDLISDDNANDFIERIFERQGSRQTQNISVRLSALPATVEFRDTLENKLCYDKANKRLFLVESIDYEDFKKLQSLSDDEHYQIAVKALWEEVNKKNEETYKVIMNQKITKQQKF